MTNKLLEKSIYEHKYAKHWLNGLIPKLSIHNLSLYIRTCKEHSLNANTLTYRPRDEHLDINSRNQLSLDN